MNKIFVMGDIFGIYFKQETEYGQGECIRRYEWHICIIPFFPIKFKTKWKLR